MEPAKPVAEKGGKKKIEDWEVESACNDILRAEEHKQKPELMALVKKHLSKKSKAMNKTMSSIQDLKDEAARMSEENRE